jgi:hypothetical protein
MNSIPFDVSVCLFMDWVGFIELGKFDSALCNKKDRKHFLDVLSSNWFVFPSNQNHGDNLSLLWIQTRKMRVCKLLLKKFELISFPEAFTLKVEHLEIQNIDHTSFETLNIFLTNCESLSSICLSGDDLQLHSAYFLECLSPEVLKRLSVVEIWSQDVHKKDEDFVSEPMINLGFYHYDLKIYSYFTFLDRKRNHRTLMYKIDSDFSIDNNFEQFSNKYTQFDEIKLYAQYKRPYDLSTILNFILLNSKRF